MQVSGSMGYFHLQILYKRESTESLAITYIYKRWNMDYIQIKYSFVTNLYYTSEKYYISTLSSFTLSSPGKENIYRYLPVTC